MTTPARFVVTAVGGVLVSLDRGARDRHVLQYQVAHRQELISHVDLPSVIASAFGLGRTGTSAYLKTVSAALAVPETVVADAERAVISSANEPLVTQLRKLPAPLELVCASNCLPIHWEQIRGVLPPNLFSRTFLSHEMGLRKPDARFFRRVLDALGASGEEALYVDERVDNVAAARGVGWSRCQVHFDNADTIGWLRQELNLL